MLAGKINSLRDSENLERHLCVWRKRLVAPFRQPTDTKPIFVMGKQRSGTSMLMRTFHRHSEVLVFDEHKDSVAFRDYRLRSSATVRELMRNARFPAACFKVICDSHLIADLHEEFPSGQFIWAYRNYLDVVNSTLRKFTNATRAIRLVCTNQPGGGWFQEGVSPTIYEKLQDAYRPDLPDFDLACLVWWARNQVFLESGLANSNRVTLVKYELLVSAPVDSLKWLYHRIALPYQKAITRNISPRSIGRHAAPIVDNKVQNLCDSCIEELDGIFLSQEPSGNRA